MSRVENWISLLEAGEPINWQREQLLLTLDMLHQAEQFATTLIERDTSADDQFANALAANQRAR